MLDPSRPDLVASARTTTRTASKIAPPRQVPASITEEVETTRRHLDLVVSHCLMMTTFAARSDETRATTTTATRTTRETATDRGTETVVRGGRTMMTRMMLGHETAGTTLTPIASKLRTSLPA